MSGFFITGTDTDAGKTILTTCLLAGLRGRNINALPMKPIQTGCEAGGVPDLDFALNHVGLAPDNATRTLMAPYRYDPPCSPHLAADMAGDKIELSQITTAFHQLKGSCDRVLAEGAGGALVPINDKESMLDLMVAFNLPIILAAHSGLGTLNHTLMSCQVLRSAGLTISGIVLIDTQPTEWTYIKQDNREILHTKTNTMVYHLPYLDISNNNVFLQAAEEHLSGLLVLN